MIMKPIKQTVYLPVKEGVLAVSHWDKDEHIQDVESCCGYFFTPEQLNEYTRNVGKAFLENAAENVEPDYWKGSCELCGSNVVDKESITNTFEETFKQFKV